MFAQFYPQLEGQPRWESFYCTSKKSSLITTIKKCLISNNMDVELDPKLVRCECNQLGN